MDIMYVYLCLCWDVIKLFVRCNLHVKVASFNKKLIRR